MRRIGLIGGLSWESTAIYYRLLNEGVRQRLGGLHSADLVLHSFDFAAIEALQASGDWPAAAARMVEAARGLEGAGAEILLIASNTMHLMADEVAAAVTCPLLHIADATGLRLQAGGHRRPALLATRYTMEQAFYRGRLEERFAMDVRIPAEPGRTLVHDVIYDELCRGEVRSASRDAYRVIIAGMVAEGADAVIMGCTEITMLLDASDSPVPLLDTTAIHCAAALDRALA